MNIVEQNTKKIDCCGCTACYAICPRKAIKMVDDLEGFKYPQINNELCINCGLCVGVCPILQADKDVVYNRKTFVYAAKNNLDDIRYKSTSGGVFSILYEFVINNGGVVYGVVCESCNHFHVVHKRAINLLDCEKFRKSKYVQSDLTDIFIQVKKDLLEGRNVLFSGTPCQVAGLKSYLRQVDTDRLLLVDIVCKAVPSPRLWQDFICFIEHKYKRRIIDYEFRCKKDGWHLNRNKCVLDNGKSFYKNKLSYNHIDLFNSHLICRPSCYHCRFSTLPHQNSDITLGDFWGIEKINLDFDDNKGVSLVVVNTDKGFKVYEKIKSNLKYIESNLDVALKKNHIDPISCNAQREQFWKDYFQKGYLFVIRKYAEYSFERRIIWKIKRSLYEIYKLMKHV